MKRTRKMLFLILAVLTLLLIGAVTYDYAIGNQRMARDPIRYSSYPEAASDNGYRKIDPTQILQLLGDGRMDVFSPMLEDPAFIESLDDISIDWMQADYLGLASAMGKYVWDDDLEEWRMYRIYFQQGCRDGVGGFAFASLVYFNDDDLSRNNIYSTRIIEIDPYHSWVRWGGRGLLPEADFAEVEEH